MESVDLAMDDLFDVAAMDEDRFDQDVDRHQSTVAELDNDAEEGPMREDAEDGDGPSDDVLAKLKDLKGAAKKRVMRPQPKLDADRLRSERGIAALPAFFDQVTFKGKGHEAEDIKKLMRGLEHWAHRLYPKSTFDDFIDRLEKLGAKRDVQTYVRRIRMDMPMFDEFAPAEEDIPGADEDEDADPFAMPAIGIRDELTDLDAEQAYDQMMEREREKQQRQQNDEGAGGSRDTPLKRQPSISTSDKPQGITPEAKSRMEANRLKALQKRAARLGVSVESLMPPKSTVSQPSNSQPSSSQPSSSQRDSGIDSQSQKSLLSDLKETVPQEIESQENKSQEAGSQENKSQETCLPEAQSSDDEDALVINENLTRETEDSESLLLRYSETPSCAAAQSDVDISTEPVNKQATHLHDAQSSDDEDALVINENLTRETELIDSESLQLRLSETQSNATAQSDVDISTEPVNKLMESESNTNIQSDSENNMDMLSESESNVIKVADSENKENSKQQANINVAETQNDGQMCLSDSSKGIAVDDNLNLYLAESPENDSSLHLRLTETEPQGERKVSDSTEYADESLVLRLSDTNVSQSEEDMETS